MGKETTDHIDIENIIQNLRSLRNDYDDSQVYLKAGQMVISYDDLMRSVPENKNIIIPNSKCLYTEVKTEKGWEKKETGEALNKSFKNSAKNLYNSKQSIESTNPKVFAVKQNTEIFKEVNNFAKYGLNHTNSAYCNRDDNRKLKSGYKISKLKKEENFEDF